MGTYKSTRIFGHQFGVLEKSPSRCGDEYGRPVPILSGEKGLYFPGAIQQSSSTAMRCSNGNHTGDTTLPSEKGNKVPINIKHLPTELLVAIMRRLPPLFLWAFRQCASLFLRLFNTHQAFYIYHGDPRPKERYFPFRMATLTVNEIQEALTMLRRRGESAEPEWQYCKPCMDVLGRGESDPVLTTLLKTRFCTGCQERHAALFFTAEDIKRFDQCQTEELVCTGRQERQEEQEE